MDAGENQFSLTRATWLPETPRIYRKTSERFTGIIEVTYPTRHQRFIQCGMLLKRPVSVGGIYTMHLAYDVLNNS
jgi:hypothetical protein